MSIDGRQLAQQTDKQEKDLYNSRGLKVASVLIVVIPATLLVALIFYIGSWTGGWLFGGVGSLVSVVVTVAILWAMKKRKR